MAQAFQHARYEPHLGQRRVHRSGVRNRVCSCGRRFGKSVIGGMELYSEAVRTRILRRWLEEMGKRREFWIVGPEYTDSEKEFRVLYDALSRVGADFDRPGTYNNPHDGDMQLSLFGGRYLVIAKSAKHPERLVGEGLNGVVMAEAAKQRQRTWTKYIRPMLADYKGWSLFSSTPEGKNWFYDLWMRGQSEVDDEWESWRMPSWRNPVVYPKGASERGLRLIRTALDARQALTSELVAASGVDPEVISLMADLSTETFNQEIGARFTEYAGRVFKDFDEEVHVKDLLYNPAWPLYAAVDYGYNNPFVWLLIQVDEFDNVYVMDEVYESGLSIDEAIDLIRYRGLAPASLRRFYPDPASPSDTKAISNALRIPAGRGTGGELEVRLRYIRAALKDRNPHLPEDDPERRPRLIFNRRCTNSISNMLDYRYPKTAAEAAEAGRPVTEKPLKKDDHAPEALGRFYVGHYGQPHDTGGSKVSDADLAA